MARPACPEHGLAMERTGLYSIAPYPDERGGLDTVWGRIYRCRRCTAEHSKEVFHVGP